jgi:hypothetical protein
LSNIEGDDEAEAAPAAAAAAMPTSRSELWQVIKNASAKRTESPLNLHQATVYYCLVKEDALPWQKALFLGLSFTIVILQAWVPAALFAEMMEGNYQDLHCSVNSDCFKFGSSFCHPAEVPLGHHHQCNKCTNAYELDDDWCMHACRPSCSWCKWTTNAVRRKASSLIIMIVHWPEYVVLRFIAALLSWIVS